MDRDQWQIILDAVKRANRHLGRLSRARYADWLIVAMYIWSVAHDRPLCWACNHAHYGRLFRPRRLPSVSQFTRRIKTDRCQRILQSVHDSLVGRQAVTALSYLDGKPLVVGNCTKDRQAKTGYAAGALAKGYKLHAWVTEDRRIPVWSVCSLNAHESPVAQQMVLQFPPLSERSLVLADQNYDAWTLYRVIAQRGGRLLVPPRGFATHPVSLRQMGPVRREALRVWQQSEPLARNVYRHRIHVEATFSNLCSFAGGLGPLPAWVRSLQRVRRWVGAKLIVYHARLFARRALTA